MAKREIGIAANIEDALEKTNFGKFNYFIIIVSGLILVNVVLESVGISFVLPVLECDLNLTYQQQGILGAVGFIGIVISSHLWGFLADTIGRKRIMHPALALEFIISVLSSFSPNFETLAVMRFLNGVLLSASSATVFAYLGEFHCKKYRNRAVLAAAFISAFTAIFFPVIAWVFINQSWQFYVPYLNIIFKPWRSYICACGIMTPVCSILFFCLPESPKYLLTMGRQKEALEVLTHVHRINTSGKNGKHAIKFEITQLVQDSDTASNIANNNSNQKGFTALMISIWHQTAPLFMRQHIRKTVIASLIQFVIFFTAHGVYMWFPFILNSSMQYTQQYNDPMCLCDILKFTQSANFTLQTNEPEECVTTLELSTYKHTIMLELIYVVLLMTVSYVIGKFGRATMLFIILLICGACGILAVLIKIPLVATYLFIIFLCCGLGITVINAIVVDIYPTNLRAMAVCISLMLGRIGSISGSNILGVLIETHCEMALYSSAGALIFAGLLGYFLPKSDVKKKETINRI